MPDAAILLASVGLFAVALALVGLGRGRLVAVWRIERSEWPLVFWFGFAFQLGLGLFCVGSALLVYIVRDVFPPE